MLSSSGLILLSLFAAVHPEIRSQQSATASSATQIHAIRVETLIDGLDSGTGGLAVDRDGNVYSADFGRRLDGRGKGGDTIYRITPAGDARVFARGFRGASGNRFDKHGHLLQSNVGGGFISRVASDGSTAVFAKGLRGPVGIAVRADGHVFVNNCSSGSISQIAPDGSVSEFCRSELLKCPNGLTLADDGNFYVSNFANGDVIRVTAAGHAERIVTLPGNNNGHIAWHQGLLYVVARSANQIYRVTTDGQAEPFVGSGNRGRDDGAPLQASLSLPNALAFSPDGKFLYINETSPTSGDPRILAPTRVRRVTLTSDAAQIKPSHVATAKIEAVDWIAGHWRGQAMNGEFEETWNPPLAGGMSGVFTFAKDNKIEFYEILTIVPDGESLTLRLKHFGPNLVGWEDKDKSEEFPLRLATRHEARFDGYIFRRIDPDRMHIVVTINREENPQRLVFDCLRVQSQRSAAQRILDQDAALAKQRDEISRTQSLANAVEGYVLGLSKLDFRNCPAEFKSAYTAHRDAWQAAIPFLRQHDALRGEMHDLFNRIREIGEENQTKLDMYNALIAETWGLVEAATPR